MKAAIRAVRSKALIVYREQDARGRQLFVVRTAQGDRKYECRRLKALISYVKGQKRPVKVFDELPESAQRVLMNNRQVGAHPDRLGDAYRPTLGDLMIGQLV